VAAPQFHRIRRSGISNVVPAALWRLRQIAFRGSLANLLHHRRRPIEVHPTQYQQTTGFRCRRIALWRKA